MFEWYDFSLHTDNADYVKLKIQKHNKTLLRNSTPEEDSPSQLRYGHQSDKSNAIVMI